MTLAFVDGIGVLVKLFRDQVPDGVNVQEDIPDRLSEQLPMVTISRAGGDSLSPVFQSDFFVHVQVWSGPSTTYPDPDQAAFELSRAVARILYWAWKNQTVVRDEDDQPMGWIAKWRESSGFQKFKDPDLPNGVGRYVAVYDLKIRNPR